MILKKDITFRKLVDPVFYKQYHADRYRAEWVYTAETVIDEMVTQHFGHELIENMAKERAIELFKDELYGPIIPELYKLRDIVLTHNKNPDRVTEALKYINKISEIINERELK